MSTWTPDELDALGLAEELDISSTRPDGSLRPFVTIWAARVGDDLYIRSAYGPQNGWYRRAVSSRTGRIRSGGIERDVTFDIPPTIPHDELDAGYREKYATMPLEYVEPVVGETAAAATLRVLPR